MFTQPELVLAESHSRSWPRRGPRHYLLFLLLILIPTLNAVGLRHKRLTYDEGNHYQYGINVLQGNTDRLDDSKMPFTALNALPQQIWNWTLPWNSHRWFHFLEKMRTGRYVTVFFSLWVGFAVFRWSRELYGITAGLFSLFLYTFCPNILAHSRLMTTDLYAAGMTTLSLYYFWRFLKRGGRVNGIKAAAAAGLSQLAKYTCIYLYPIFLLIGFAKFCRNAIGDPRSLFTPRIGRQLAAFSGYALLFLFVSLLIINAGFLFNKSLTPFKDYEFKSDFFRTLRSQSPWLGQMPVPVPYPYLEGLDWVKFYDEPGKGLGRVYLFGKLKILAREPGFKGYFFYCLLYKLPIATQLFILAAFFNYWVKRKSYRFWEDEIFLLTPVFFFAVYFNFYFNTEVGIRFFLVAFPLLFVFCGNLLKEGFAFARKERIIFAVLASYLVISVLSYTPHYLSYFNEFVLDRKMAYKILADSNLDWGENEWYLQKYTERHPEALVSPSAPTAGKIVVGANELTGVNADPEKYRWLRENFEPVGHVAYSYLIFDVSPEALHAAQATNP